MEWINEGNANDGGQPTTMCGPILAAGGIAGTCWITGALCGSFCAIKF